MPYAPSELKRTGTGDG